MKRKRPKCLHCEERQQQRGVYCEPCWIRARGRALHASIDMAMGKVTEAYKGPLYTADPAWWQEGKASL